MSKTAIPVALRRLVAERFQHRCSYCQTSELIERVNSRRLWISAGWHPPK